MKQDKGFSVQLEAEDQPLGWTAIGIVIPIETGFSL
jgi:hypothetical protein